MNLLQSYNLLILLITRNLLQFNNYNNFIQIQVNWSNISNKKLLIWLFGENLLQFICKCVKNK